ncbi:MAG: hypothetical protein HYV07_22130 [Deltaproteobacteria bacterium]|nr:hypothetical protein [Deltaproteobacteria bacterium]
MTEGLALLLALFAPAVVIGGIVEGRRRRARIVNAFTRAAKELGLRVDRLAPTVVRAHGVIDGFGVAIHTSRFGSDGAAVPSTLWAVDGGGRLPFDLMVRERRNGETTGGTGDAAFDAEVFVAGRDVSVSSVLGADVRAMLRPLVRTGVRIQAGRLEASEQALIDDPHHVVRRARLLVEAATQLTRQPAGPQALRRVLDSDPEPRVRLRAARALFLNFAESEEAISAATAIAARELSEEEAALSFYASVVARDRGRAVLRSGLHDGSLPVSLRVFALERLARSDEANDRVEALAHGLATPMLRPHAVELVTSLAATGWRNPKLEEIVVNALAAAEPGVLSSVLVALAPVATEASERALIGLLEHDDVDVRVTAAEILGTAGTHLAVVPLRRCAEGILAPKELRSTVERAIHAIKARLEERPGALSIAEGSATGSLALTEDLGGLSLPERSNEGPARDAPPRTKKL